jgi:hypothetical protein
MYLAFTGITGFLLFIGSLLYSALSSKKINYSEVDYMEVHKVLTQARKLQNKRDYDLENPSLKTLLKNTPVKIRDLITKRIKQGRLTINEAKTILKRVNND